MRRWLFLSNYHWLALLTAAAVSATLVAWISFGLINVAMANIDFLQRYGLMAIREGGLLQAVELGLRGLVALLFYLLFKAIEAELIYRWRNKDH